MIRKKEHPNQSRQETQGWLKQRKQGKERDPGHKEATGRAQVPTLPLYTLIPSPSLKPPLSLERV